MCGIVATLLYPQKRTDAEWDAIRETTTRNLIFNEERGNAATGVVVLQINGQVQVQKMAIPASEFVRTSEYRELIYKVGPQTTLILGHTRLPTKGSPIQNGNNHPLQAGPVFGVHNGQVDNDDALFARFGFPRQAQVDSEIIFRLLEPMSPEDLNGDYLSAICPHLQLLCGQFTFMACDQRRPERLLVLKRDNPLCIHFLPAWNALVFSSRYMFLRKAFGRSLVTEVLQRDHLLLFDALHIPSLGILPFDKLVFNSRD